MKNRIGTASKPALVAAKLILISTLLAIFGSQGFAQNPPPALPAGVQDAVKLSKAGMSDDVIVSQIKNGGASYNLSADQIIYLSGQGVSQNVIKALISGGGAAPTAPAVPPPSAAPAPPGFPPGAAPGAPPPGGPPMDPSAGAPSVPMVPPGAPPGTPPVSYDYFHDQLGGAGTWVATPNHGWCWRPAVAVADPFWRPYFDAGHWVYTDAGWCWQSDYPWGDIVFHYGRWHRDSVGWLWVPGYDWAPAWVCWRQSEGYCGWAPLPPAAVFRAGVGFAYGGRVGVDLDFGLAPFDFTFVAYDHFWDRNLHAFLLPRDRVDFVFGHSFIANGYRFDHGRFIVEGLGRDHIERFTHHEVRIEAPVFRFGIGARDDHRGFRDDHSRDDHRDDRRDDRRGGDRRDR
ncbi:MAG TPA: DUF6600 domain-containing protein [Verrucomicrobiae bacterium]|nr:DUF6600 domain-containing protein [Verrucomicrobiae bacterium]